MKKIQHVPRRQELMGSKWSQHVYGKRQCAFELINRAERLKNVVCTIVAGVVMVCVFAVLHD